MSNTLLLVKLILWGLVFLPFITPFFVWFDTSTRQRRVWVRYEPAKINWATLKREKRKVHCESYYPGRWFRIPTPSPDA